ncbi:hypothetical protein Ahy_A03g014538 [Arachis hypogaea]|uniref:MULE transposase domain-containing protein n=1 Tax=Arachis hypogaea TaxID=3818 RepID=A0A445DY04_ARAHY|nr:hypothetical protein Ahy_A03g014538 [Arachis hypogaea]
MIVYLEGKAEADLLVIAKHITSDDRLANLILANGSSSLDYQYKRLAVIFSGSNNHKQITIFGFRLLLDESVSLYRWMLDNLLEIMCSKKPCVVLTDGDKVIIKAISEVLSDATHHLCAWHVEKK